MEGIFILYKIKHFFVALVYNFTLYEYIYFNMKKTILSVCLMAVTSSLLAQQKINAYANLKDVTVYAGAAELQHTAQANIPLGASELILSNISNQVDNNSIQIGAGPEVSVLSVRTIKNLLSNDVKTEEYKAAEKVYKEQLNKLTLIKNKLATEESSLVLLEKNQQITGGQATVTTQAISQLADFYKTKYLETKNNISSLQLELTEQEDIFERYNTQFQEVSGQNTASNTQLVVQLMSSKASNQNLNISYISRAANWTPFYELRANNLSSPLAIAYKANVSQTTGIDWKNVNLTLSTGNPTLGGNAPTINPWFLSYQENLEMAYASNDMVAAAPKPLKTMLRGKSSPNQYVNPFENQLSATFEIDIPYTILSNGQANSINLQQYQQAASYRYYAAPILEKDAFLIAEVTDYEKLNLIPGLANVIFENMFVGKTYINPAEASDTLKLSLGRDKMISIKREKLTDFSSTQTIGSSKKQTVQFEIKIKNNKKSPVLLRLEDQFPISTDKSMQVELLETAKGKADMETGILTWDLNLAAGESKSIKFGYSVKYPKDKTIVLR